MTYPTLPTLSLSGEESEILARNRTQLGAVRRANQRQEEYYEGSYTVKSLGIAVPPQLEKVDAVAEWPATCVDVMAERINWLGFQSSGELLGLDAFDQDNELPVEVAQVVLDSMIFGLGYMEVFAGDKDEPGVIGSAVSPLSATGIYDERKRRLSSGYTKRREGRATIETLYLPEQTIVIEREQGRETIDRIQHGLGRVQMVRFANRLRSSRTSGRSEITRAIRYYTDAAVRTLVGAEINREFYTAPQRYAAGAEPEQFGVDEDSTTAEKRQAGFNAVMGNFLVVPPNEDGTVPTIGHFPVSPPTPYLEQVRALSQLTSSAAALPSSYFGFVTDNPESADAIRQNEIRLIKRAEDKIGMHSRSMREVARLAVMARGESVADQELRKVSSKWADAATPTRAAAADETVKLVGANVLPPDSEVTWDRIGLSPREQELLRKAMNGGAVASLLTGLREQAAQAVADPEVEALATRATPVGE